MMPRQWYKKGWVHASTLGLLFIVAHLLHFHRCKGWKAGCMTALPALSLILHPHRAGLLSL